MKNGAHQNTETGATCPKCGGLAYAGGSCLRCGARLPREQKREQPGEYEIAAAQWGADFAYPEDEPRAEAPDMSNERAATIAWVLSVLLDGTRDPKRIGRRALSLAYVLGSEFAPAKSVRALAKLYGVSPTRAHQHLNEIRAKILAIPRVSDWGP